MLIIRSYLATGFKTYKKVNNWCNCKLVSVAVFSFKWCERRERTGLKLLIHALRDVALLHMVKGDFGNRLLHTTIGSSSGRIMTLYLNITLVSFASFIKYCLLFLPRKDFPSPYFKISIKPIK